MAITILLPVNSSPHINTINTIAIENKNAPNNFPNCGNVGYNTAADTFDKIVATTIKKPARIALKKYLPN